MANEWATADTFDATKLNQKTRFVGSGLQATTFLTSPQVGQMVFCTSSDATFKADRLSTYTSASAWSTPKLVEQTEETAGTTPVAGNLNTVNYRNYMIFTLPTTYKLYAITGVDFRSGSVTPANIQIGVDIVDSTAPSLNSSMLCALFILYATSSATTNYNIPVTGVVSNLIRGGTICGAWVSASASNAVTLVTGATGYRKLIAYAPPNYADSNTWESNTAYTAALKIYYRGYN